MLEAGSAHDSIKDEDKFIGFFPKFSASDLERLRKSIGKKFQPMTRFFRFLSANFYDVCKIPSAYCFICFSIVGTNGTRRTKQLFYIISIDNADWN